MGTVFSEEKSIFFVGGRGDQTGRVADAGGCTLDWWDTEVPNDTVAEKAAAMEKLMGGDGAPVISLDAQAYTFVDDRITGSAGAFFFAEIGMVAYVIEDPIPGSDVETGRYTITDKEGGGDWIELLGIGGTDDTNVDIRIGGAFDDLNTAIDSTNAESHGVLIHTSLNETLAAAVSIAEGGHTLRNIFKKIVGYNTTPGDMSLGGTYYESPFDILQREAIDPTKCVTIDADGNTFDILDIATGVDNIIFENLHLTNAVGYATGFVAGTSTNFVFRNCRFSNLNTAVYAEVDSVLIDSCYAHNDLAWAPYGFLAGAKNGVVLNCVSDIGAGHIAEWTVGASGSAIGNVSVGGNFGYRIAGVGSGVSIINNTLYGTLTRGVQMDGGDNAIIFNNIFCLTPGATGIYCRNGGSVTYNDHNLFIDTAGNALTPVGTEYADGEAPVIGVNSIETDPLFVDAENGNFRLKTNSPARRIGKPTIGAT